MIPARPVNPTTCPHCGYSNGGMFWKCPLCKREVSHRGDRLVGYTAALASVFIVAYLAAEGA